MPFSHHTGALQSAPGAGVPIPVTDVLVWCGRCRVVSEGAAWARGGQCPHCAEPLSARFFWDDLRRIKPKLPPSPTIGQAINAYEY